MFDFSEWRVAYSRFSSGDAVVWEMYSRKHYPGQRGKAATSTATRTKSQSNGDKILKKKGRERDERGNK